MADLRHLLAIYVHAHQAGNSVPPHIDAEARAALAAEPPAPASSSPLDLDALLSPEGSYEPGTGQEDGAQLVDQLQWWAPVHGCETLENLLDRIRGRILPHLRPPIAGIDVPGPDGDYGGLQELCEAEGVDVRIGAPLLKRAWAVWGAAQPPAPAPAADGERAAALLRQPAPAPVPVPVAERPWDRPGWCDAEGRCWLGDPGDGYFIPSWWYRRPGAPSLTVSLPHWAIPQPPQGGEVES